MNRECNLLPGSDVVQHHRKGLTKELPEIGTKLYEPSDSWFEQNKLKSAIDERYSLLKEPRIERETLLSVAKWDPDKKKVVVLKKKGKEWETYGHHDSNDNLDYLNPEEALFLIESNSLALMHGNIEMSVEIGYTLLLSQETGCTLEQYRVFSHLSKLGYKLIRHKKPEPVPALLSDVDTSNDLVVSEEEEEVEDDSCITVDDNHSDKESTAKKNEENNEVVLIDDSSSDSSNDDVVIVDVIMKSKNSNVIDILDDESRDSDIVMLDAPGLVEFPLDNWGFVHRRVFLPEAAAEPHGFIDPFLISRPEWDILRDIPNVKSKRSWLYRPDESLVPHGVWPFHYKYLIDLNESKFDDGERRGGYHRGRRGGFRGGNAYYLKRQVSQMKDYTVSLMKMVSQLVGSDGEGVIPPPPDLFHGSNYRSQRGYNYRGRPSPSWGCVSLSNCGNISGNRVSMMEVSSTSEIVELIDDEESLPGTKRSLKLEEDIKPKRFKHEFDAVSVGSSSPSSVKIELVFKEEVNVKSESEDTKPDVSSLISTYCVKTESSVKTEQNDEDTTVDTCISKFNTNCDSGNNPIDKETFPESQVIDSENASLSVPISEVFEVQSNDSCKNSGSIQGNDTLSVSLSLDNSGKQGSCTPSSEEVSREGKQLSNTTDINDQNTTVNANLSKSNTNYDSRDERYTDETAPLSSENNQNKGVCTPHCQNISTVGASVTDVEIDGAKTKETPNNSQRSLNINNCETFSENSKKVPTEIPSPSVPISEVFEAQTNDSCKNSGSTQGNDTVSASLSLDNSGNQGSCTPSSQEVSRDEKQSSNTTDINDQNTTVNANLSKSNTNFDSREKKSTDETTPPSLENNQNKEVCTPPCKNISTLGASVTDMEINGTETKETPNNSQRGLNNCETLSKNSNKVPTDIHFSTNECDKNINSNNKPFDNCENQENVSVDNSVSISLSLDSCQIQEHFDTNKLTSKEDTSVNKADRADDKRKDNSEKSSLQEQTVPQSIKSLDKNESQVDQDTCSSIPSDKYTPSDDKTTSKPVNISIANSNPEINLSMCSEIPEDEIKKGWKQFKGGEKTLKLGSQNDGGEKSQRESVTRSIDDVDEATVDLGSPLIQSEHCTSLDNVLSRLQIFGEYKSKNTLREPEEIKVTYDVYLPTSTYYKNISPKPNLRLIILRLEDSFPDAEQMMHLRNLYNDTTSFLFAVILKESVAYYLYDRVYLSVDNEMM